MKNKKLKYYLKNNLIGLIVGGIIFGSLGVYAAITFPSNEVSFDPSNSTLSSTNVKDAIDELYKKCTNPSAADQIIEDAGLEKDPYECRYFFTGANPNNYITFNDEQAGWRIISVECDGTIKIMRNESAIITQYNSNAYGYDYYWTRPATLNTYLNEDYYSNSLNSIAQSQIIVKDWNIGAITWNNNSMANQINEEASKKWSGKVALPTVSEYIRISSNQSNCETFYLNNDLNGRSDCAKTNWMSKSRSGYWWTITPEKPNFAINYAIYYSDGLISGMDVTRSNAIHPTIYLSSEVKITGGTGTQSDPYTIE